MYNTFIGHNANAFNLNLNDNFNMFQNKTVINNNNMNQFNNMMNKKYCDNNRHDFDYNNNNNIYLNNNNNFNNNNCNNNNFNINNCNNNNFDNNNVNNNNFNNQNNNNNNYNMIDMNMFYFLNSTWQNFEMYNKNKPNDYSTMRIIKKSSSNDIDYSDSLRNVSKTVIDLQPNYQGIKINIFFQNSSGTKVNVLSPGDITVEDLLLNYVSKMGISTDAIDKAIYFLFNGAKLKKNDKKKIYELGIQNSTIIIVIDRNAVLGA